MKKIKVLLVDDNDNTRSSIKKLLELDKAIDVVAEAASGKEALEQIPVMEPEIVIMDISMPVMDGIEATAYISRHYPGVYVIMVSVNDEIHNFKKAMLAGAKEYLIKPLSPADLNETVRKVAELKRKDASAGSVLPEDKPVNSPRENKIISIFGPKGGVGKSIICANVAAAAARNHKYRVALVDLDVQFGDIGVIMNVNPRKTIADLMQEGEIFEKSVLEEYMYERHGVSILAAPNRPELAELVAPAKTTAILQSCQELYGFTLVDHSSYLNENSLSGLEMSDLVLLIVTLDLPGIKNAKKGIEILQSLQLLNRTRLILNRSTTPAGIEPRDVERVLEVKIRVEVPVDDKLVLSSVNQGNPFVKMNPRAAISKSIANILQIIEE